MKKFNVKREKRKLWLRTHKTSIIKYGSIFICGFVLCLSIMYFSRANFSTRVTFDVIDARVAPFSSGDVQIVAFYKDGEKVDEMPQKYMYMFSDYECSNGATLVWNAVEWNMTISNVTAKTKCSLYFVKSTTLIDKVRYLASSGSISGTDEITVDGNGIGLAYDGTIDKNLRYIGTNPNNYILYNCSDYLNPSTSTCELWRIIGVFNNIKTNSEGTTTESLVKIIRNDSIGDYSWDSSASSVNLGNGINEWSQADLMTELNGTYYYAQSGTCYNNSNNSTTSCNFTSTGLKNVDTRNMIQQVLWNTGAGNGNNIQGGNYWTASNMYKWERNSYTGKQCIQNNQYCSDSVTRTTTWYGSVALMYPSDYGYAVGGTVRNTCLEITTNSYTSNNCYTNDWLHYSLNDQWVISPNGNPSSANSVSLVTKYGSVNGTSAYTPNAVRPTVFLKSDVTINDNNGTQDGSSSKPYFLVP